jgi:dolichol-phosphate mannosyltransferase
VIEGALSASGGMIGVLDGDMQHDETRLPEMFRLLATGADLVVGTRKLEGGSADEGLGSPARIWLSHQGIRLAQVLTRTRLSDPMSGFFVLRRSLFDRLAPRLTGQGFKILLDLVLAAPEPLEIMEVPYRFRPRAAGTSKLDVLVLFQFAGLLIDKLLRGTVPPRFIAFAAVGAVGVVVNLLVLLAAQRLGLRFGTAQTIGTIIAMVANFQMNNSLTYRTVRLRGRRYWRGLILFMLACGLGAVANIGIAQALHAQSTGSAASSVAGALVGVVWNYAISATLVWRAR